ncbi:MAG: response regulator, partial [Gemmatimonadetes bacterium]|nr:response regulator [Gemmatimonadota bacterium]
MTDTGSPGSATTVLVVDDTPANLEVLVSALSHARFGVLVATNGSEALERARRQEVDLILLDVMMPGIDGFETCARLK